MLVLCCVPVCPTSINHISISCNTPIAVYLQRATDFLWVSSSPPIQCPANFPFCQFLDISIFSYCNSWGQVQVDIVGPFAGVHTMWIWKEDKHTGTSTPPSALTFPLCWSCFSHVSLQWSASRKHSSNLNARISIWSELWVHEWVSEQDTQREGERDTVNHQPQAASVTSQLLDRGLGRKWEVRQAEMIERKTVRDRRTEFVGLFIFGSLGDLFSFVLFLDKREIFL